MNANLETHGFSLTRAIAAHVHTRLDESLGRYADDIVSVDVFLRDTNGPKGGDDKTALFRVRLRDGQAVTIASVHADVYAATRISARRARRAVGRALKKSQRLARRELRLLRQTQQLPLPDPV